MDVLEHAGQDPRDGTGVRVEMRDRIRVDGGLAIVVLVFVIDEDIVGGHFDVGIVAAIVFQGCGSNKTEVKLR